jgi:hypothetical protein
MTQDTIHNGGGRGCTSEPIRKIRQKSCGPALLFCCSFFHTHLVFKSSFLIPLQFMFYKHSCLHSSNNTPFQVHNISSFSLYSYYLVLIQLSPRLAHSMPVYTMCSSGPDYSPTLMTEKAAPCQISAHVNQTT